MGQLVAQASHATLRNLKLIEPQRAEVHERIELLQSFLGNFGSSDTQALQAEKSLQMHEPRVGDGRAVELQRAELRQCSQMAFTVTT